KLVASLPSRSTTLTASSKQWPVPEAGGRSAPRASRSSRSHSWKAERSLRSDAAQRSARVPRRSEVSSMEGRGMYYKDGGGGGERKGLNRDPCAEAMAVSTIALGLNREVVVLPIVRSTSSPF